MKSDSKYWNYDGLIIDSTGCSTSFDPRSSTAPTTPLALGHLINHPSDPSRPDLKPNVMVVPYEFSRAQGQKYSQLIPNRYRAPEKFMYKVANNHVLPNSFIRVELFSRIHCRPWRSSARWKSKMKSFFWIIVSLPKHSLLGTNRSMIAHYGGGTYRWRPTRTYTQLRLFVKHV